MVIKKYDVSKLSWVPEKTVDVMGGDLTNEAVIEILSLSVEEIDWMPDEKHNNLIELIKQKPRLWKQLVSKKSPDFGSPEENNFIELIKQNPESWKQLFIAVVPATQEEVLEATYNWRYWPWLPAAELPKDDAPVEYGDLIPDFWARVAKLKI